MVYIKKNVWFILKLKNVKDTVGGRNPATQSIWRNYHYLQGLHLRWSRISSINSM